MSPLAKIATLIVTLIFSFILTSQLAQAAKIEPLNDAGNPVGGVDENTAKVKVTFTNLEKNKKYVLCKSSKNNFCPQEDAISVTSDPINGTITAVVCAMDNDEVKTGCDQNNYFHTNKYEIRLYTEDRQDKVDSISFNVAHYYPKVEFIPPKPKPGDLVEVKICGNRRPPDNPGRNTYDFNIKSLGNSPQISNPPNVIVPNGGCASTTFFANSEGNYEIDIGYINDDSFSLYQINFSVENDADGGSSFVIKDPDNKEGLNFSLIPGKNPCDPDGTCPTAIGDIPTSLTALAGKILTLGIGLAGGLALILMVVGAIRVLISSGDQQKLSGGRDMIVAAVAGLLFLIFSVLILQFIGVQILNLTFK